MKHEKCYLCLRTRVTLVPGPYTHQGGGLYVLPPLAACGERSRTTYGELSRTTYGEPCRTTCHEQGRMRGSQCQGVRLAHSLLLWGYISIRFFQRVFQSLALYRFMNERCGSR